MILINLLPHREARRQRRKIAYFVALGVSAGVGALLVGLWFAVLQQMTSAQQRRNEFLSAEIKKLEGQIKDIANLKAEIDTLTARQKAVEGLQVDRNVPVHLLNELVAQTPEGVYLVTLKQDDTGLTINGIAQTNERVSELLRNTGNLSQWLSAPQLIEIRAATREQQRVFEFSMRVSIKKPQDAAAAAAAASAPAAASSPAAATNVASKKV